MAKRRFRQRPPESSTQSPVGGNPSRPVRTRATSRAAGPQPRYSRGGALLRTAFFDRSADRVARELLGCWLAVRGVDGRVTRHAVLETEAYLGAHDLACHAAKGMTARNAVMFGPAGMWYVYLCYGMHWMLNIVTGREGLPAAVLIRAAGEQVGPGRLTRALGIDRAYDGRSASRRSGLWFESGEPVLPRWIERTPRIGVGYAGEWAAKPLRFVVDPEKICTEGRKR
jgi:DNA-3-methyladenine glycosylase